MNDLTKKLKEKILDVAHSSISPIDQNFNLKRFAILLDGVFDEQELLKVRYKSPPLPVTTPKISLNETQVMQIIKEFGDNPYFLVEPEKKCPMTENQIEAFEAVKRINEEISDKYEKIINEDPTKNWNNMYPPVLSITFGDYWISIDLNIMIGDIPHTEINVYNPKNGNRIFFEESDSYESFYNCINRRLKEIKKELNNYGNFC